MAETTPTEYFIQGVTKSGKTFRPSDWSERLCGVMSVFGPGAKGPNAHLQYSVYVRPTMLGNLKSRHPRFAACGTSSRWHSISS